VAGDSFTVGANAGDNGTDYNFGEAVNT